MTGSYFWLPISPFSAEKAALTGTIKSGSQTGDTTIPQFAF
jgi:hypothetical protein